MSCFKLLHIVHAFSYLVRRRLDIGHAYLLGLTTIRNASPTPSQTSWHGLWRPDRLELAGPYPMAAHNSQDRQVNAAWLHEAAAATLDSPPKTAVHMLTS